MSSVAVSGFTHMLKQEHNRTGRREEGGGRQPVCTEPSVSMLIRGKRQLLRFEFGSGDIASLIWHYGLSQTRSLEAPLSHQCKGMAVARVEEGTMGPLCLRRTFPQVNDTFWSSGK